MDTSIPPSTNNAESDFSRRDFLKFCSTVAVAIGLGPAMGSKVAAALTSASRPKILWLHFAECTGCTEAVLRSVDPFFDDLIMSAVSLDYHETLMAGAGSSVHEVLTKTAADNAGNFICVVEGAIPGPFQNKADDGYYGAINGRTMLSIAREICPKAKYNITIGNCAAFGGIPNAAPNPTEAKGLIAALKDLDLPHVINVPGCPPNPVSFIGTVTFLLLNDRVPPVDYFLRPTFAYGNTNHGNKDQHCPYYDDFEKTAEDPTNRCQRYRGCKGPNTYNNCRTAYFNKDGEFVNFPMKSEHPCIGCSEPQFWDTNKPYWKITAKKVEDKIFYPSSLADAKKVFEKENIGVLPNSIKHSNQSAINDNDVKVFNALGRRVKSQAVNKTKRVQKQPLGRGMLFEKTKDRVRKMVKL